MVREVFTLAKENTPAIIFIDEIDAIAVKRTDEVYKGDREVQRTFMQLLSELDGFANTDGIMFLAATNREDVLDPAILRPGRFDRIIRFDLPNEEAREMIIKIHSRKMNLKDVDIPSLAKKTEGFSGAEIEQVVISALYDAFEAGRDLEEVDLLNNIALSIPLSQTMREQMTALRNWARTHARPASYPYANRATWMAVERERTAVS